MVEHPREELERYLKNLVWWFNEMKDTDYPWDAVILGFGNVQVYSQQEMLGRISMLCELLKLPYKLENVGGQHRIIYGGELQ